MVVDLGGITIENDVLIGPGADFPVGRPGQRPPASPPPFGRLVLVGNG